jgi:hypothetical protein
MALLFLDVTICPICGSVIKNNQKVYSFSPFIQNKKDPFFIFNDASFHLECLQQHLLGQAAISFGEQLIFETRPVNRRCKIDNEVINDYEDYIFFNLLSSNKEDNIYKFNFTTLNRNNLDKWQARDQFLEAAEKMVRDDKWEEIDSFK